MVKVILSDTNTICYNVNDRWNTIGYIVDHANHIVDIVVTNKKARERYVVATFFLDNILGISDIDSDNLTDVLSERWNIAD